VLNCNNLTITQLPYFPTGIPLATDLPDGSVDETAWLATIGRHALAHGGAPDSIGSAITLVPLPWLALPSQPNTPNGPTLPQPAVPVQPQRQWRGTALYLAGDHAGGAARCALEAALGARWGSVQKCLKLPIRVDYEMATCLANVRWVSKGLYDHRVEQLALHDLMSKICDTIRAPAVWTAYAQRRGSPVLDPMSYQTGKAPRN